MSVYVPPTVTDYGSLVDLTAAHHSAGAEDGHMKSHPPPITG